MQQKHRHFLCLEETCYFPILKRGLNGASHISSNGSPAKIEMSSQLKLQTRCIAICTIMLHTKALVAPSLAKTVCKCQQDRPGLEQAVEPST